MIEPGDNGTAKVWFRVMFFGDGWDGRATGKESIDKNNTFVILIVIVLIYGLLSKCEGTEFTMSVDFMN